MERLLLTFVIGLVFNARADFVCEPPNASYGPLPPVLPETYRMSYERNDLTRNESTFIDVWYDWPNQRARVEEDSLVSSTDRKRTVSLYDFSRSFYFSYTVPRPGQDEMSDERDFLCRYVNITRESDGNLHFYDKLEKPLRMVDIYQAMLFGGRYRYKFVDSVHDESSRFIKANKFSSCFTDKMSKKTYNISYYWTTTDEDSQPIKYEVFGGITSQQNQQELSEVVDEVLSVVRFERNPKFDSSVFMLPRHMVCEDDPGVMQPGEFPRIAPDFAWKEETLVFKYDGESQSERNVTEVFKKVWSSEHHQLCRVDWTPTAEEVRKTYLEEFANKPISVIADMTYGAVFITDKNSGSCVVKPLTENSTYWIKSQNGTFRLRSASEILDMTGPRIMKGQYSERNNPVIVFATEFEDSRNAPSTIAHETSFRIDEDIQVESNGWYYVVPVSQLTRILSSDTESGQPGQQSIVQTSYFGFRSEFFQYHTFEAPGCIAHHKRKMFQIRFPGQLWTQVSKRQAHFLDLLRFEMRFRGNFGTAMRIQGLGVYYHDKTVVATMTFLEPLEEMILTDVSIDDAAKSITDDVNGGNFHVPFEFAGDEKDVIALKNTFKEFSFTDGPPERDLAHLKRSVREVVQKSYATPNSGYSTGNLVGLCVGAFVVGLLGGFSLVYIRSMSSKMTSSDEVLMTDMETTTEVSAMQQPGPSGWTKAEAQLERS